MSGQSPMAGSYKQDNEPLGSQKVGNSMTDHQLLRTLAPWT
jgi:hypothetical protein